MAQAGVYAPSAVVAPEVTVRVAGVVREYVSMSWAGDTTGGLPEQVVSAGTGMRSRTGSITWAPQSPVEVEPPHPLRRTGGWPPREGDTVTIDASVDTGSGPYQFRRFTGRIGRTTGSLIDGTLTSEITDTLGDLLRSIVTVPPMLTGDYGRSMRVAFLAFEQASLGLIPPADAGCVLHSVPQGGISPTIGGGVTFSPEGSWSETGDPWGFSTWDNLMTSTTSEGRSGRSVLIIGRGSSFHSPNEVTVRFADGSLVRLTHTRSTNALVLKSGSTTLWAGTYTGTEASPVLALYITGSTVRVWTSITSSVSVTATLSSTSVDAVWGLKLAAVDVAYANLTTAQANARVARTPAMPAGIIRSSLEQERTKATRGVENVSARDVIDAWSQATLTSVWMDETGRTQCVPRDRLVSRAPSRTVYVDERVFSGAWSIGDDSIRSSVIVNGLSGAIDMIGDGSAQKTLIYQEDSTRSFETTATVERFIEAPAEQDWGPVDLLASRYGTDSHMGDQAGRGTWVGAVTSLRDSNDDPEQWAQISGVGYTCAIERLGQRTLKVTETISNIPGNRTVYLKTASAGTALHPAYQGVPSPTIRGSWKTLWAEYTVTGVTKGPSWAEPLELDAGWWLTPADAQRVADALAAEVTTPIPTITGATVLWDPRRQIGDVETWIARDRTGAISWQATVLVSGYAESWEGRVPEQSVDVRVISLTDPREGKAYTNLAAAYSDYSGMQSGTYQGVYDALPNAI